MAMDLLVTDWIAATEVVKVEDARSLADRGATVLEAEPDLPPAVTAECHVRLAALRLLSGSPDLASRHAAHAATLAFDMPAEAQLHVLPRALSVLRTTAQTMADSSQLADQAIDRGGEIVSGAMATAIGAADKSITQIAVIRAIAAEIEHLPEQQVGSVHSYLSQHAARVALDLETAGELQLAHHASQSIDHPN